MARIAFGSPEALAVLEADRAEERKRREAPEKIEKLQAELDELEADMDGMEGEIDALQRGLDVMDARRSRLVNQISELSQRIDEV